MDSEENDGALSPFLFIHTEQSVPSRNRFRAESPSFNLIGFVYDFFISRTPAASPHWVPFMGGLNTLTSQKQSGFGHS
jgi:hypothetical protein